MKECYYCHNEIPADSEVCPMCGSDLTEIEKDANQEEKVLRYVVRPEDYIKKEAGSPKRQKRGFQIQHLLQGTAQYFSFMVSRTVRPVTAKGSADASPFFGYIYMLVAALLSAAVLTRTIFVLDKGYHLLAQISILPSLTWQFSFLEWMWKMSLFFFLYFLALPLFSFLIKKLFLKEEVSFQSLVVQFAGMSALFHLLLWMALLLSLIAPLAMAFLILLIAALHALSYLAAFVVSVYQEKTSATTDGDKRFQLSLLGISLHLLFAAGLVFFLFKI